jgi:O-antigen ligase
VIEHGLAANRFQREQDRRNRLLIGGCIAAAVAAGFLAGNLAEANKVAVLPAFLVLLVPFVTWRRPATAVTGLAVMALVVEQYRIGIPSGDFTDHIPLFTSLSDAFKLSGLYANPMEILFAITALVLLIRVGEQRVRMPRTALSRGLAVVLGLVLAGAVHGVISGGDYKMALWEIRPMVYVGVMYFFASQLPARTETITMVLWVFVAGVVFKAIQGVLLIPAFLAATPRPDYLLSHEDSFFFTLYIILAIALWLFKQKGRLRAVTTLLLPMVVLVNLVNNRRTSWAILAVALLALIVLVWIRIPDRRRLIVGIGIAVTVVGPIYLPLEWNKTGLLAGPAEAIRSQFSPSVRESLSDLYRVQENANLVLNIQRAPLIGLGYGIPIDYALPMVADLTRTDPFLKYIPHNDVLYVWMRLGAVGALAFWTFIGLACVSACRLVRSPDPRLSVYGAFVVCALIGYVILGYLDLGFFWFRIAMTMGWLLGTLEVAHRVEAQDSAAAEPVRPPTEAVRVGRAPAARRRPTPAPGLD